MESTALAYAFVAKDKIVAHGLVVTVHDGGGFVYYEEFDPRLRMKHWVKTLEDAEIWLKNVSKSRKRLVRPLMSEDVEQVVLAQTDDSIVHEA